MGGCFPSYAHTHLVGLKMKFFVLPLATPSRSTMKDGEGHLGLLHVQECEQSITIDGKFLFLEALTLRIPTVYGPGEGNRRER